MAIDFQSGGYSNGYSNGYSIQPKTIELSPINMWKLELDSGSSIPNTSPSGM